MGEYIQDLMKIEYEVLLGTIEENGIILSIMIPTYKRGGDLSKSIDSIIYQSERYKDIKVIVISNDPEDNLKDIIKKYEGTRLCIVRNKSNLGMCGNINRCILLANSEYIAYLHDDDFLEPNYCEVIHKFIDSGKIDCLIPARYVNYADDEWGQRHLKSLKWKSCITNFFIEKKSKTLLKVNSRDILNAGRNIFGAPSCGTIYRRSKMLQVGGWPIEWKYAFDLIFYTKFSHIANVYMYRDPLGTYSMGDSASKSGKVQLEFFEALKSILDESQGTFYKKYYNEYLHLFANGLSIDAQKEIENKYYLKGDYRINWLKYKYLKFKVNLYYLTKGLCLERIKG